MLDICLVGGSCFIFNVCYLYLFTYTGVQNYFQSRICSCRLTVTQRSSHVEQELPILLEHTSSPPVSSEIRVARSLVCRSLFVLLSFFFWSFYCLSFLDVRLLITPLVSANFSSTYWNILL